MGTPLFETSNQLFVLLFTVYGGVVLGLLYDALFIIRKTLGGKKYLTALFDALFWLMAIAIAFGLLYYATEGEFKFFHLLGFAFGAMLYFLGPGKGVRWLYNKICRSLRALFSRFKATGLYKLIFK